MGELLDIKWRAVEGAPANFEGGYLAPAIVRPANEFLRFGVRFDIDFFKGQLSDAKELLGAAAIGAPLGRVHSNEGVHNENLDTWVSIGARGEAMPFPQNEFTALQNRKGKLSLEGVGCFQTNHGACQRLASALQIHLRVIESLQPFFRSGLGFFRAIHIDLLRAFT